MDARLLPPAAFFLLIFACGLAPALAPPTDEPDVRLARIDSLWNDGERSRAWDLTVESLDAVRAEADTILLGELLVRKGQFLVFTGRNRQAEPDLQEALALAEHLGSTSLKLRASRWFSLSMGRQGRREEAQVLYEELVALARREEDPFHEGWGLVGLGWMAGWAGRYGEAVAHYDSATTCLLEAGDIEGEIWARNCIGINLDKHGAYYEAIASFETTVARARELGLPNSEAMALNNIGRLEFILGRPDRGLELFETAYRIHRELGHQREAMTAANNIALCQQNLGLGHEAIETFERQLAECRRKGYRDLEIACLLKIARALELQDRDDAALARCRELEALDEDMTIEDRVEALRIVADVTAKNSGEAEAFALLLDGHERLPIGDDFMSELSLTFQLGRHGAAVEPRAALDHLQVAFELARERDIVTAMIDAKYHMGRAYVALGETDSSIAYMTAAADLWRSARRIQKDPKWREQRALKGRRIFTDLTAAHLGETPAETAPARTAAAFDLLQHYKARTLQERMRGPGMVRKGAAEPESLPPTTLSRLQGGVLKPGDLFLDFYLGPKHSYLFCVTTDQARAIALPPLKAFRHKLDGYFDLVSSPGLTSPAVLAEVGLDLRDTLFGDILDMLAEASTVYVSADDAVHRMPLLDLPYENVFGSGRPLWIRVPSATILAGFIDKAGLERPTAGDLLALAAESGIPERPLEGAFAEVEHLAGTYRDVTLRRPDRDASPVELQELVPYDVLHIASHVFVDDGSPWRSEILQAPPGDPVNLRAASIAESRLSARLAVLSSCFSGGGQITTGEGVLGLANAFVAAGVPAVLASLWAVDDAVTAGFVRLFYSGLADGLGTAEALRAAQERLRAEPATAHPFYWAGFVLIGDGHVHVDLRERWFTPRVRLAAVIAAAALLFLLFRRRVRG